MGNDASKSSSKSPQGSKAKKGAQAPSDLASLGLDPALFEDPDESEFDDGGDEGFDVDAMLQTATSSTASKKKPAKTPEAVLASLGNIGDENDDEEIHLTEEDLNDPGLLGELAEMGGGEWAESEILKIEVTKTTTSAPMRSKIQAPHEDEDDSEFSEAELNDPALLKELHSMGWAEEAPKKAKKADPAKISQQKELITARSSEYKVAAVKAKQAGDLSAAKEYLRMYKAIDERIATLDAGELTDLSTLPPSLNKPAAKENPPLAAVPQAKPAPEPSAKPAAKSEPQPATSAPQKPSLPAKPAAQQTAEKPRPEPQKNQEPAKVAPVKETKAEAPKANPAVKSPPAPTKAPAKQVATPKPSNSDKLATQGATVDRLVSEYKAAAIKAKQSGDLEQAKNHMKVYKSLLQHQETLKTGKPIDESSLPPPPGASAQKAAVPSKQAATKQAVTPQKRPNSASQPAQKQAKPAPSKQAKPVPSKQAAKQAPAKAGSTAGAANTDEWEDSNPVENIISNDVYEWAIDLANKEIISFKAKKKPVPEELANRLQQLQMDLNLLQTKVNMEQLSQDDYLASLKAKIAQETANARALIGSGKKDWASLAVQRAKIMQNEIKTIMEDQEEE
eukprot:TRINITY_DN5618_c0_g1_i1.p1 TRINITY_DN5618_c0_g1~~TRINITY_DN5618_c0_g1_i1.p1  ORF type:complete len:620 (-),score=147.42 TRINITY_DN5618_c0_g1_i1:61-1920(-)